LEAAKGLAELGLEPTFADACVFARQDKSLIVGLYIDNMVILACDLSVVQEFKEAIAKRWEIKDLGEVKKILGLEVTRNRSARTIRIAQTGFTDEIVNEYGFVDARPASTPIGSPEAIEPVFEGETLADVGRYQRVVGQLMYLMRGSRPDVCFVVSRLSRYVAKPAERH
jgi:Reverse transcriptase (RNA-dependent DNA polymerase)